MNTFLTGAWLILVIFCLQRYFAFVYFDLDEFKPATRLRKWWGVFLSFVVPAYAVSLGANDPKRFVLGGLALTTMLTPIILPDLDPPKAHSIREWLYLHTVGKWFADLCGSLVIYGLAVTCSIFGHFWLYGYAGIAGIFALSRSLWIKIQRERVPEVAAPSLHSLVFMIAIVFTWAGLLFDSINTGVTGKDLSQIDWQTEFSALYKPSLEGVICGWLLSRWPWLSWFRGKLSSMPD
jgi:hypothetical protein